MLMDAHRSAVDHLHIAVVGLADGGHDAVPNPGFAPAHEAVVAGRGRAEFLRQGSPRRTRSQHPEDSVQNPPIINPRHAARFVRLFGSSGAITFHSKPLSSYPTMIPLPQLGT